MLQIQGYDIVEELHSSPQTLIYRARRGEDDKEVILKTTQQRSPGFRLQSAFENEFVLTRDLDIVGAPLYLDYIRSENRPVLIYKDIGAISLRRYLTRGQIELDTFIILALKLSHILADVHEQNIIHKDIKPDNILIRPETNDVYLVDFGIATRISGSREPVLNPKQLEGTLIYISPEQTGRINRSIDFRTDLYSLGVTFYEILAGHPPFGARDPMELIHAHIARSPEPLHTQAPGIPMMISRIVGKLLEKTPEDRYQSTAGLIADLQFCRDSLEKTGAISLEEVGREDHSSRFRIPEKLYGREDQMELLSQSYAKVERGSSEFALVTGPAGMGKTSLVKERFQEMVGGNGFFSVGKFDQFEQHLPYSAIMQALSGVITQILMESEARIGEWQTVLREAVGPNGSILIAEMPDLELLIGPQSPVKELPAEESAERFRIVLLNFIRCLARKDCPLVLFFDDLQWADSASLDLLENILTAHGIHFTLIVGAYRSEEVDGAHPVGILMSKLRESVEIFSIELEPLRRPHIAELMAETLKHDVGDVAELAELVLEKTSGTPFFVYQFIDSLHQEGLLRYDVEQHAWLWELGDIEKADITDNVIELLIGKLKRLKPATLELLKTASCMGKRFLVDDLAAFVEQPVVDVAAQLIEAVEQHFLVAATSGFQVLAGQGVIGATIMTEEVAADASLRFVHDRIQDAVYSLLSAEERAEVHMHLGTLMLPPSIAEEAHLAREDLFRLVTHFAQAGDLVQAQELRTRLAGLNLRAATVAKDANAYDAALDYVEKGIALLPVPTDRSHYATEHGLLALQAECLYLTAQPEASEKAFDMVISMSATRLEKISLYKKKLVLLSARAEITKAIEVGAEGLKLFGIKLPTSKNRARMSMMLELVGVRRRLIGKTPEDLLKMAPINDPDFFELVNFMGLLSLPAYSYGPEVLGFVILKMMNLCLRYGNPSPGSGVYHYYAIILLLAFGDHNKAYRFSRLNLELFDKLDVPTDPREKLEFGFYHLIAHWKDDVRKDIDRFKDIYVRLLEKGDLFWANLALSHRLWTLMTLGENLDTIQAEARVTMQRLSHRKGENALQSAIPRYNSLLALKGQIDPPWSLDTPEYDFDATLKQLEADNASTSIDGLIIPKMQLAFHFEHYEEVPDLMELGKKHMPQMAGIYYASDWYVYESLALAAMSDSATGSTRKGYVKKIRGNVKMLKKWAGRCANNYEPFYLLTAAELARVEGRHTQAPELYNQALESARKYGFLQHEAIANELAGRFYLAAGNRKIAFSFLSDAILAYERWGATAKVNHLEEKYAEEIPDLRQVFRGIDGDFTQTLGSSYLLSESLDLNTILKASTAISAEIELELLLQRLLRIVMENGGAERGFLILEREEGFLIEAQGEGDRIRVLDGIPLEGSGLLPETVAHFAIRTQQNIVLDNAQKDEKFSRDSVIVSRGIRSALCAPILHQGQLLGLIYLDNSLVEGAFTHERLELLSLLSGQVAVSLQNALLYQNLENKVLQRTAEIRRQKEEIEVQKNVIEEEKRKSDRLLLNILPRETADELKRYGKAKARRYEQATVLFTDVGRFTELSEKLDPEALVQLLDRYFSAFDSIMDKHGIEKIKTIGDAYMAVSGVPKPLENSAIPAVRAALDMQKYIREHPHGLGEDIPAFSMRVGLHTGPVVAGVVGTRKFAYDIWGDTVNLAARMESSGKLGQVNISGETHRLVKDAFPTTYRGKVHAKNVGEVDMYFVQP